MTRTMRTFDTLLFMVSAVRQLASVLLATTWMTLLSGTAEARGVASANTPGRHIVSVKDSPGYYSTSDPESMSVVVGRRLSAPRVRKPFTGGARSLDDLGRAVCRSLHRGDRDSLLSLCISADEFRVILWREFPQSRPAVGLTWQDAWTVLYARQRAGCSHAVRDYAGHSYEFLRFEGDTITRYLNFKLHNRLALVVRDDEGRVQKWKWLRSVAERGGKFKIYSTED